MNEKKRNPLIVILFTIFLDVLGIGILVPVIPLLLADPQSPQYLLPQGYSIGQGYILLGLLVATYPLGQFFATPILGQLSDNYGRKKILAFSLIGTCVGYLVFAFAILTKNIPLLFLSRTIDGITGGNIAVAQAAIADVTKPENRAKTFGLMGAAFGIGFIIGPFIGGKLSDPQILPFFNASTPFWFAAFLSFCNVVSVLFFFPETLETRMRHHIKWTKSIENIARAINIKDLKFVFLTNFLFQGGFSFFTTFFSVYLIRRFAFTQGNIGDFFAYLGLWIAFTQVVVTRKLSTKYVPDQILRITLIGSGIAIAFYLFPTYAWQLLFITPLLALNMGLSQANITALISTTADATIQGEVLGINASVQALAQAIPPILSGIIAASLTPESPIIISSVVIITAGITFLMFHKHFQRQKTI